MLQFAYICWVALCPNTWYIWEKVTQTAETNVYSECLGEMFYGGLVIPFYLGYHLVLTFLCPLFWRNDLPDRESGILKSPITVLGLLCSFISSCTCFMWIIPMYMYRIVVFFWWMDCFLNQCEIIVLKTSSNWLWLKVYFVGY